MLTITISDSNKPGKTDMIRAEQVVVFALAGIENDKMDIHATYKASAAFIQTLIDEHVLQDAHCRAVTGKGIREVMKEIGLGGLFD